LALCGLALVKTPPLAAQVPSAAATTLVLSARSYDRANQFDSARAAYELAATQLPSIADWLRLRAAGVTRDSADRARDYATITLPAARGRIPWTEAQARERMGDAAGAARAYDALGARDDALRNTATLVAASPDSTARAAFHAALFAFIGNHPRPGDARAAIDIADRFYGPLSLDDERAVAHAAAAAGAAPRAVAAFERLGLASAPSGLSGEEAFAYATALARTHRDADAARAFAAVTGAGVAPALAREARYQRGRALVAAGDKPQARVVLRGLVRAAPRDTASADALMLLADLATDDRQDAAARRAFLEVGTRFSKSAVAPRARFRAALIAFIADRPRVAGLEWDALVTRYHQADDATAARYWSGRAWSRAGQRRLAAQRWRAVLASDPLSYYASLSAHRLNAPGPLDLVSRDTVVGAVPPVADSALARAATLDALGMSVESHFELDRVPRDAGDAPESMLAVGAALARAGDASRAVSLGWRLIERGDSAWRDGRAMRLVYPLLYGDTLVAEAHARGLDPALVAAVVRQESAFNPRAVSAVGARGLMQVMPSIGRGLAQARGIGPWDPSLLDVPGINLMLGIAHLATFRALERGDLVRTLAAYNAGPSRVTTWSAKRGVDDPEVFVERIPFVETRDYVRAILRGREIYTALYGL
jgi:peptidoglycan lytic transglycosylase